MPIEIIPVRALNDNYCYLIFTKSTSPDRSPAMVIDPSEALPVKKALLDNGRSLGLIVNTHHHHDHVGGNLELAREFQAPIFCSAHDLQRIPGANRGLSDHEPFTYTGIEFETLAIPGHTQGQIALYIREAEALFVGDTVFAMGCGRLSEGTAQQMFASLGKIQRLPPTTRLYFGHEYTEKNAAFATSLDQENTEIAARLQAALDAGAHDRKSLVPAPALADEMRVNPFLKAPTLSEFTRLRKLRDTF